MRLDYDDKNDYNYTERENIEVKWEESYSRIGYNSMLEIDPQLTPKDEYEYTWKLGKDTISTDPILLWPVNVPEGNYQLVALGQIENRRTAPYFL